MLVVILLIMESMEFRKDADVTGLPPVPVNPESYHCGGCVASDAKRSAYTAVTPNAKAYARFL